MYPLHLTDLLEGEEPSQFDGEDLLSLVFSRQLLSKAIFVLSRCGNVTGKDEQLTIP